MGQLVMLWCCALSAAVSARIVFPEVDSFPTVCELQDGTNGTCINLEYCASALTAKNVTTCYIDGGTQFICCKDDLWNDHVYHRLTEGCAADVFGMFKGFNTEFQKLPSQNVTGCAPNIFGINKGIKAEIRELPSQNVTGCADDVFGIIKGINTAYQEFPYMAALGFESSLAEEGPYEYKCGGVLIEPTYVLTAAHCANLNNVAPAVVLVGGINLTDTSTIPIKVLKVIIHPGYKNAESYNDIALLQLETNAQKQRICVWSLYPMDDLNVTAIGYGHTQFAGVGSDSLLKTYLSIVPNSKCAEFYTTEDALPKGLAEAQLCAKDMERGSDTCQGDSGGPLILFRKGKNGNVTPFLVGITSFGRACALDPPGVYTRVSEYVDWIESVLYGE